MFRVLKPRPGRATTLHSSMADAILVEASCSALANMQEGAAGITTMRRALPMPSNDIISKSNVVSWFTLTIYRQLGGMDALACRPRGSVSMEYIGAALDLIA